MSVYKEISLATLIVNRANDRHGELENETAAMAWLFSNQEDHMRNLAYDIVAEGNIFEPPLVFDDAGHNIIYDGNRRITCLKLLDAPRRAPTVELQEHFSSLRKNWKGAFPTAVECRLESDRDVIDDILFRRHTGSQKGVGQTNWDDRMKANFVSRTGRGSALNVAAEIERRLGAANMLPNGGKIPLSNMNRLLSAEPFRNRVGISVSKGHLVFTHNEAAVLKALRQVAQDLANQKLVLGDIWDVDGKQAYLDKLESYKILPTASDRLTKPPSMPGVPNPRPIPPPAKPTPPAPRISLIPAVAYSIAWPGRLHRHKAIWDELQFGLRMDDHPNAISVLLRVLLELSIENYIAQTKLNTIQGGDNLATRAVKVAEDLQVTNKIDAKYVGILKKFKHAEMLVSADVIAHPDASS